jgi:hypothetical protein
MTTAAQLKREVEIISKALRISEPKPTPSPSIPLTAFTDSERQTILNAEEILTQHQLNPRVAYINIHTANPDTVTEEYSDTEKQTILAAYHLVTNYRATQPAESLS